MPALEFRPPINVIKPRHVQQCWAMKIGRSAILDITEKRLRGLPKPFFPYNRVLHRPNRRLIDARVGVDDREQNFLMQRAEQRLAEVLVTVQHIALLCRLAHALLHLHLLSPD